MICSLIFTRLLLVPGVGSVAGMRTGLIATLKQVGGPISLCR
jgi:hypothetical protein